MTPEHSLINNALAQTANTLWIVDESIGNFLPSHKSKTIIANRYDQYIKLKDFAESCYFSDFDFKPLNGESFDLIIYRIAKEKAVNLHVITESIKLLAPEGKLMILGYKQEGMPSLVKLLKGQNASLNVIKHKKQLQEVTVHTHGEPPALMDCDYSLMETLAFGELSLKSKAGVFGWQKEDPGSKLLIRALKQVEIDYSTLTALDLGCGYGYLSARLSELGCKHITATDNNAAAISCCEANFSALHVNGEVVADDCAQSIQERFDLVICNPPFHQGFDHNKSLTERFTEQSFRHLKPGGIAVFVVNKFIGIEKIASQYYKKSTLLAEENGFKVISFQIK